jgi:alpha-mannosidase
MLVSPYSFLQIEPRNILLSTLKSTAVDRAAATTTTTAIIVRIYETEGQKTIARLRFGRQVKKVYRLDLLENELDKGTAIGREVLEIELLPFKIITLKIQF